MGDTLKSLLKELPGVPAILRTETYKHVRNEMALCFQQRRNHLFTQFLRVPRQLEALAGPVCDFLLPDCGGRSLRITLCGCSTGAEPYSIASVLLTRRPEVNFKIQAFDIDRKTLEKARTGVYTREEVTSSRMVNEVFIEDTFCSEENLYHVKPSVLNRVSFELTNVLDTDLADKAGLSDIVFAQNILFHLRRKEAVLAFNNICRILRPRAALFIDGMDLDLRHKLTETRRLEPLDYRIEEIHNEARVERGPAWPYEYWGLEPFSMSRKDWKRRYCTIFLKNTP